MSQRSIVPQALVVCVLCVLTASSGARPDTVYLKNGNFIDGVVKRQDEKRVELEVGTVGRLEIPFASVLSIEKNDRKGSDHATIVAGLKPDDGDKRSDLKKSLLRKGARAGTAAKGPRFRAERGEDEEAGEAADDGEDRVEDADGDDAGDDATDAEAADGGDREAGEDMVEDTTENAERTGGAEGAEGAEGAAGETTARGKAGDDHGAEPDGDTEADEANAQVDTDGDSELPAAADEERELDPELRATIEALIADLVRQKPKHRVRAERRLKSIGLPAVPFLLEVAKHESPLVRIAVFRHFASFGDDRVIEACIHALADENEYVRDHAHRTLERVTAEDFGFRPLAPLAQRKKSERAWREWWKVESKKLEELRRQSRKR